MQTEHNETVVERAVTYVKQILGVPPATHEVEETPTETAPEVTAENAMRLNPNRFAMESVEQMYADAHVAPESSVAPEPKLGFPARDNEVPEETDAERLRREVDEPPRQKSALELNAESARAEDGE